eukprot:gene31064-biopygen5671
MTIFNKCPALKRICFWGATGDLALDRLPPCLHALEVKLRPHHDNPVEMSATLSPLSSLTQLKEAVLHGFPFTSVAALDSCTALRSLDLKDCLALTNISSLSAFPNLHSLSLANCGPLRDLTVLSVSCKLHTLDLSRCRQL